MNVLVISAHPDDETLGCGGTLLKHIERGDRISWVVVTEAFQPDWSEEVIRRMTRQVESVARAYPVEKTFKLGFHTTRLDSLPIGQIIEAIRSVAEVVRPNIVYVVNGGDVHSDHRIVFAATMSVFKPLYMQRLGVNRILSYETISSTDAGVSQLCAPFLPTVFSQITGFMDRKIEIMQLYETEIQPDPLPRGPSALRSFARFRGATVGVEYAEAFMLLRELI
jgi:LmbE family N-acetylglucosaminyl deacetylase